MSKETKSRMKIIDRPTQWKRCTAAIVGLMLLAASAVAQTEFKYFGDNGPLSGSTRPGLDDVWRGTDAISDLFRKAHVVDQASSPTGPG